MDPAADLDMEDTASVVSSSSSKSLKLSARAKRLVAEYRLKALKERHQLEEKQHQLEEKQKNIVYQKELLDHESAIEEARIEEAVWEEEEENTEPEQRKERYDSARQPEDGYDSARQLDDRFDSARQPEDICNSARQPVDRCDSARKLADSCDSARKPADRCDSAHRPADRSDSAHRSPETCDSVYRPMEKSDPVRDRVYVCDRARGYEERCDRAYEREKVYDRVHERESVRHNTSRSGVSMTTGSDPRISNGNCGKSTLSNSVDPDNSSSDVSLQRLASVLHEGFHLPKPELLTFSGSALDYCKFITNFETNIEAKVFDNRLRLSYLIQYCEGEAKSCIEDCVLLDPDQGYRRAREILKSRYGRPHVIARTYIDRLVSGPQVRASNVDDLSKLALDMQKCELTLTQLGFLSDLDC